MLRMVEDGWQLLTDASAGLSDRFRSDTCW